MKNKILICILMSLILVGCGESNNDSTQINESESVVETTDGTESVDSDATEDTEVVDVNPNYKYTYYGKENKEVEFNIDDYVTLCDYKNIKLDVDVSKKVTDKDVEAFILDKVKNIPLEEEIKDRKDVRSSDYIYVVYDQDEKKQEYLISVATESGYNQSVLIGKNVGDTVILKASSDSNSTETEEASGLSAKITKIVKRSNVLNLKDLTASYVKDTLDFDSLKDLKAYAKRYLESEKLNSISVKLADYLIANSKVRIPNGLVDYYVDKAMATLDKSAHDSGVSSLDLFLSTQFGQNTDDYVKNLRDGMKDYVKQTLICKAINTKENLKYDDKQYEAYLQMSADLQGFKSVVKMQSYYTEEDLLDEFVNNYLPLNYVLSLTKINYKD